MEKDTFVPEWWPQGVPYNPSVAADIEGADIEELEAAGDMHDKLSKNDNPK